MRRSTAFCACAVAATVLAAQTVASTAGMKTGSRYSGGTVIASLRSDSLALHSSPMSKAVIARVGRKTVFSSKPQLASPAKRTAGSGRLRAAREWDLTASPPWSKVSLTRRAFVLEADLSRFELVVWRWGDRERRFRIAIGAPGTPTPTGRFSVTDKLHIFPETLRLLHPRPLRPSASPLRGWLGGDRLAIHEGPRFGERHLRGLPPRYGLGHALSVANDPARHADRHSPIGKGPGYSNPRPFLVTELCQKQGEASMRNRRTRAVSPCFRSTA